jgi:hypothetical protein
MRYPIAIIVAPLVPVFLVTLLNVASRGNVLPDALATAMWSYLAALVFGAPSFLILRRRAWLKWWQFGLAGLIAGAVAALVQFSVFIALAVSAGASLTEFASLAPFIAVCAVVGSAIALAFWVLTRP